VAEVQVSLDRAGEVFITLYNINGELVHQVYQGIMEAGVNLIKLQDEDLPAGFYFIRLESIYGRETKKVIIR
jgi:hypothetical protein